MKKYIRKTARWGGKQYAAYGKTELEAMTKLAEKLAAAKRGEEIISGSMTVDAWYAQWKATYKDPKGLTKKSLGMYDEKYKKYISPSIGRLRLQDVRDTHLQRILNKQAGMSLSHVEKVRRVLREMFSRARKSRLIPYDPSEDLELPAATEGKHRSITEAERKVILEVAEYHQAGLWILTLLYTGIRPGEAAALNWRDIDFESNMIHVHAALESGSNRIKAPKTEAGNRDIPIRSDLRWRLLEAKGKPFDPVFKTQTKGRHNSGSISRLWKSFVREMNIRMGAEVYRNQIKEPKVAPDLTMYCLRHTFATDCARAGVPLETVRWLMGHADISTTANIYQHRDDTTLRAAMDLLDSYDVKTDVNEQNGVVKSIAAQ